MGIAKHIKTAMLQKEISRSELAAAVGRPEQTISNNLYRDTMISKTAERMADVLDCDIVLQDRKTGKIY